MTRPARAAGGGAARSSLSRPPRPTPDTRRHSTLTMRTARPRRRPTLARRSRSFQREAGECRRVSGVGLTPPPPKRRRVSAPRREATPPPASDDPLRSEAAFEAVLRRGERDWPAVRAWLTERVEYIPAEAGYADLLGSQKWAVVEWLAGPPAGSATAPTA